jgi:hypothetical protein
VLPAVLQVTHERAERAARLTGGERQHLFSNSPHFFNDFGQQRRICLGKRILKFQFPSVTGIRFFRGQLDLKCRNFFFILRQPILVGDEQLHFQVIDVSLRHSSSNLVDWRNRLVVWAEATLGASFFFFLLLVMGFSSESPTSKTVSRVLGRSEFCLGFAPDHTYHSNWHRYGPQGHRHDG